MKKNRFLIPAAAFALIGTVLLLVPHPNPAGMGRDAAVWAMALACVSILFGRKGRFRPVGLWVAAAGFAGVMTLARSFGLQGDTGWISAHKPQALLYFVGCLLLGFSVSKLGLELLSSPSGNGKCSLKAPAWAGLFLLCWLPWYICLFPGTVSNDSISQMRMIFGLDPLSGANPIVQTGLVALFCRIGTAVNNPDAGVALYCLVQGILMALLAGSVTAEWTGNLKWPVFALFAFCPVFPVFAFCVGKDTNFAMAVLWLSLNLYRLLRGQKAAVPLCVSAVLCVLLRNAGLWPAAAALLCAVLYLRGKNILPAAAALLCTVLTAVILQSFVIPGLQAAPMPESENYSVPLQQVTRMALGNRIREAERETIEKVLPLEEAKAVYNGELSDRVKELWNESAPAEHKQAFWKTWLRLCLKNPGTAFSSLFHNSYGYLAPGYISALKPTLILGDQSSGTADIKGTYDFSVNPPAERLRSFLKKAESIPLYRLLLSPGLYGWITLLAALALLKKPKLLIPVLPALFTLIGCLFSPVNGYFRYAMPLYLCAPFLLLMIRKGKNE